MKKQYGLLAKGNDMIRWYADNHNGTICRGGGIPERNAFVETLQNVGYSYWHAEKKVGMFHIDLYVEVQKKTWVSQRIFLGNVFPQIFSPIDPLYERIGEETRVVKKEEVEVVSEHKRPPVIEEEVRVIPIVTTKNTTLEERRKRIVSIGGTWMEYGDLHTHIVLIYKDPKVLAVVLDCGIQRTFVMVQERHPSLIDRLYEQLINLLFDCIVSKAIVFGNRTMVMGSNYEQFEGILFFIKEEDGVDQLGLTFPCTCVGNHPAEEETWFRCDPLDLPVFVAALGDYVSDHVERPLKKIK